MVTKCLGLLIGDEVDWPDTLEALLHRLGNRIEYRGKSYDINVRRLRIRPFSLTAPSRYDLVIDRLAYWHFAPREWLKKAALVNRTYLLNNPFTFQSMEKHSAYCAMIRLGLHIPETWLIPQKVNPDTEKFRRTAALYHEHFNLPGIAEQVGYPVFLKPFDGGGWRGVTRVTDLRKLHEAYNNSGQSLMHLQKGLADYDIFCRSLAIGPQVISLHFQPEKPHHARYKVDHNFLTPEIGREVTTITKLINAFFCWDFNSCETIHKDGIAWPIDFANACPDVAVTSLHYYYPWAIKALLAWSLFCLVSERPVQIAMQPQKYFDIADSERSYDEKLAAYEKLADGHFQREQFEEFRQTSLAGLDDAMLDLVQAPEFDTILHNTVEATFPRHEHGMFFAHYRGLLSLWAQGQQPQPEAVEEEPEAAPEAPA